jgi:protein MPE1
MTSSVFFKFKSQKEPSRVSFDGTGISVFELKREIINKSRLGDGTDFELAIYNEDTNEGEISLRLLKFYWCIIEICSLKGLEYDDDTSIIPRSTSIIARRLPAARPGKGGAARYISGKMPVGPRSASRAEPQTAVQDNNSIGITSGLDNPKSEDEKIKALFSLQESQWREQQQELSSFVSRSLNYLPSIMANFLPPVFLFRLREAEPSQPTFPTTPRPQDICAIVVGKRVMSIPSLFPCLFLSPRLTCT